MKPVYISPPLRLSYRARIICWLSFNEWLFSWMLAFGLGCALGSIAAWLLLT